MKFISKSGKTYWRNPEKAKLRRKEYERLKIINRLTVIQTAIAKEMIVLGTCCAKSINDATKSYLTQLKKDGFSIKHKLTERSNARKVNYIISQLKKTNDNEHTR
jgi:glycine cleavage system protein P-like pyridoxal-binding family